MIPNTPKSNGGGSLLRRGLRLHKDACKTPPRASGGLRKRPLNKPSKTSDAKLVQTTRVGEIVHESSVELGALA